ncbi:GTP 3',8-cyclase MoaA [Helicobacter sp. MIT 14-3879]|uniref:GTP 3',8-cyclase MoaA n=1 Tax=Helicobacter sp. MIT 14-3879 TaxID=2040649 RepID=UPI000E1EFE8C|nr:GTP 3',8-cyclase MoaA [Helicobacter sp. MIT 14-3879]RDU65100.1 GTP 3',8-cyclase MoaA [Helicobacter sp. MIT 14-3879]
MQKSNNTLIDSFGRKIDYIRISVTKNCNFRCKYCMPNTPEIIEEDLIPLPKMLEFLKISMDFGVKKIRITGGEPLLRKDLPTFIKGIYNYKNDVEVSLTTNAFLLKKYAKELKDAGLKRINVSLDSLDSKKIIIISKKDALQNVLDSIKEAKSVGLGIKLNMVPLKNINDNEIISLLEFALQNGFLIRYIEYMNNIFASSQIQGLRGEEILKIISQKYNFKMLQKENFGPAKLYEINSIKEGLLSNATNNLDVKKFTFGIIAPHNDDFCTSCNRIRLTSDGIICPCLYFEDAVDISQAIRNGDREEMINGLLDSIKNKPEKNKWQENIQSSRAFYHTGG